MTKRMFVFCLVETFCFPPFCFCSICSYFVLTNNFPAKRSFSSHLVQRGTVNGPEKCKVAALHHAVIVFFSVVDTLTGNFPFSTFSFNIIIVVVNKIFSKPCRISMGRHMYYTHISVSRSLEMDGFLV